MKFLSHLLSFLFARCVRCYPAGFRLQFEEEMCEVFENAFKEAKEHNFRAVISFLLREFRDFPINMIHEHCSHLEETFKGATHHKSELNQVTTSNQVERSNWMNGRDHQRSLRMPSTQQRILASLPLFLFGLGISLTSLTRGGPWYSVPPWRLIFSIVIGLLPMAIIATVGMIALIRRIPEWGITWIGSAFMGLIVFVKTLAEEFADVDQRIISEPVEIGLVILLFLTGVALLVIVGIRGWQCGGLLSIGFSVTFTLTFLWAVTAAPFYRHDLALWAGPISLVAAGMTYTYANGTQSTRIIILVGVGILNYGSILLANTLWHGWYLAKGETFSPIPFILFMLAFHICGPMMGLITPSIQHRFRQA